MIISAFMIAVHPEDLRASLNKEIQDSLSAKVLYLIQVVVAYND